MIKKNRKAIKVASVVQKTEELPKVEPSDQPNVQDNPSADVEVQQQNPKIGQPAQDSTKPTSANNNIKGIVQSGATAKPRTKGAKAEDVFVHDIHGFKFSQSLVNLFQTFVMNELQFKDKDDDQLPPEEKYFHSVALQNNRLWIFMPGQNLLYRQLLQDDGTTCKRDQNKFSSVVTRRQGLGKARIQRLQVDESGNNCFLIDKNRFFYNNFNYNEIQMVDLCDSAQNVHSEEVIAQNTAFQITAIQILHVEEPTDYSSEEVIMVVLGTNKGQLYHGCMLQQYAQSAQDYKEDDFSLIEKFEKFLDLPEPANNIIDIQIVKKLNNMVILVATSTTLYQMTGEMPKNILQSYQRDPQKLFQHSINMQNGPRMSLIDDRIDTNELLGRQTINSIVGGRPNQFGFTDNDSDQNFTDDTSIFGSDDMRDKKGVQAMQRQMRGPPVYQPCLILYYYDNMQFKSDDPRRKRSPYPKKVAGFAWKHKKKLYCGEYLSIDDPNLTADSLRTSRSHLEEYEYIRRNKDYETTRGQTPAPDSFAITLYNVIFMYPNNITVLSRIRNEVVYNVNFDSTQQLRDVQLDCRRHRLMAYFYHKKIVMSNLQGEDNDAWKVYEKQNFFDEALKHCKTDKQKENVSTQIAFKLFFKRKEYDKAARFLLMSGIRFEKVILMYLQDDRSRIVQGSQNQAQSVKVDFGSGMSNNLNKKDDLPRSKKCHLIKYLQLVFDKIKTLSLSGKKQPVDLQAAWTIKTSDKWYAQCIVLCLLIAKLNLSSIAHLRSYNDRDERDTMVEQCDVCQKKVRQAQGDPEKAERKVKKTFMADASKINFEGKDAAIVRLLLSHGMQYEAINYAQKVHSNPRFIVIDFFSQLKYESALDVMVNLVEKQEKLSLFTRNVSTFMTKIQPETIFQSLRTCKYDNFRELRLDKLAVAIQNIKKEDFGNAVKFLQEICIQNWRTNVRAVYNLVFYLLLNSNTKGPGSSDGRSTDFKFCLYGCPDPNELNTQEIRARETGRNQHNTTSNSDSLPSCCNLTQYLFDFDRKRQSGQLVQMEVPLAINFTIKKIQDEKIALNLAKDPRSHPKHKMNQYRTGSTRDQQLNKSGQPQESEQVKKHRDNIKFYRKILAILYGIVGLIKKSVEIAVECDAFQLAMDYANRPKLKRQKKALWLIITKKLIDNSKENQEGGLDQNSAKQTQEALRVIRETSFLNVEEVLQLFPNQLNQGQVDQMKEALCNCLDDYEKKMNNMLTSIQTNTKTTVMLRKERRQRRKMVLSVKPADMCMICYDVVFKNRDDGEMTAAFIYPCGHVFHRECLRSLIYDYKTKNKQIEPAIEFINSTFEKIDDVRFKTEKEKQKLAEAQNQSRGLMTSASNAYSSTKKVFSSLFQPKDEEGDIKKFSQELTQETREQIQPLLEAIDKILRQDCVLCGSLLLDMIDNDVGVKNWGNQKTGADCDSDDDERKMNIMSEHETSDAFGAKQKIRKYDDCSEGEDQGDRDQGEQEQKNQLDELDELEEWEWEIK